MKKRKFKQRLSHTLRIPVVMLAEFQDDEAGLYTGDGHNSRGGDHMVCKKVSRRLRARVGRCYWLCLDRNKPAHVKAIRATVHRPFEQGYLRHDVGVRRSNDINGLMMQALEDLIEDNYGCFINNEGLTGYIWLEARTP